MNDIEMIERWQVKKDPEAFAGLMTRYNPVVIKFTNQYGKTGVNKNAMKTQARTQVIAAINTYNPNAGTQPITHVYNYMKKMNRAANNSLTSGHIPEARLTQMSMYKTTSDNLQDRLGREPSIDELADELAWDPREVTRMEKELTGETTASNAEFDFFGNSTVGQSKDATLAEYLYSDLDGRDKVIFEHTYGLGGRKILNNKDLAAKLNTNEMSVSRAKKKMANTLKEYR